MASSSSTMFSSTEKDLTSENIDSSATSTGPHEINNDVDGTVNSDLNLGVNDGAIHGNLSASSSSSRLLDVDNHHIQKSIFVDDEIRSLIVQGHSTQKKAFELIEGTTASNLVGSDQELTDTANKKISEVLTTTRSSEVQPCVLPSIVADHSTSQTAVAAAVNNEQPAQKKKHIMISYNHATAAIMAEKIYKRLKDRNYNVWLDTVDLHNSVFDAMGEAVDNCYILLPCLNTGYSESAFATKEIKYAAEQKIDIIPCMMEEGFRPSGGLGIIKCDLLHIEFYDEKKFEESFEKLIAEINYIEKKLAMKSVPIPPTGVSTCPLGMLTTMTSSSTIDVNFCSGLDAIISEHVSATNASSLRRENLNEKEFQRFLYKVMQEFSPETLQSFQSNQSDDADNTRKQENDNDRLIQHLMEEQTRFAEFVRTQQEKNARNEQYILHNDVRLEAFKRFEKKQEEHNAYIARRHFIQSEELKPLVLDPTSPDHASLRFEFSRRQQEQERNNRISEQLLQQVQQMTELVITQQQQHAHQLTELLAAQQQQHARDTDALHQVLNRSLENNESLRSTLDQRMTPPNTQQLQENPLNFDIFNKLFQTIILLWTLIILLKHE